MIAEVVVDVHSKTDENNVYRVYIDQVLFTERTFSWPAKESYVEEHMVMQDDPGNIHRVRVSPADQFELQNIKVNGVPSFDTFSI